MFNFPKVVLVSLVALVFTPVYAENCFIARKNGHTIKQLGDCTKRYSPFSTFKIPLAIMGFDSNVLTSPSSPAVPFNSTIETKYVTYYNPEKYPIMLIWKKAHTPKSWMQNSVVWYSRYITDHLGMKKFQEYVNKFNYGNKDINGKSKNDGLMNSWIDDSLEISAFEQVIFIENLANKKLPASKQAQNYTTAIIKLEPVFDDWQLYGKTGGSFKLGWFVGWIEKNGKKIAFAQYIEQPEDSLISGGRVAKEVAKDNLISLIIDQENNKN